MNKEPIYALISDTGYTVTTSQFHFLRNYKQLGSPFIKKFATLEEASDYLISRAYVLDTYEGLTTGIPAVQPSTLRPNTIFQLGHPSNPGLLDYIELIPKGATKNE